MKLYATGQQQFCAAHAATKITMLKKLITCTSAIIIFTLTHAQGPAADSLPQPLQEVTIIGSRYKTLSGSGVVITPVVLAKLNQPDVTKILRTVPGVNIRDEEGYGLRPNIGLRGTPVNRSAKITLMEDGILVAPAPYADPSAYYFPTVARMQGIEVLKGSSQIQYGPYTIGGALNLLSTPIPKSFSGHALASYGSFGTNQQRVWLGDSQSNLDYVFEINRLASHGFKKLDGGGNTGFDRRDVMAKLRLHTREGAKTPQSVTLKVMSMTEDGHESYLGLTYEDFKASPNRRYAATQKDRLDMNHQHASLTHTISPAIGLHLNTTAYYNRTFRNWARVNTVGGQGLNNILADPLTHALPYRIMTGQANGNITYQSAARSFQVKGLQSNLQYSFTTSQFTHRIQAGLRYHEDEADRIATQSTYAMADGTMILTAAGVTGNAENQIRSANAWATYLQYNLEYKGLTISPGLRYEKVKLGLSNYGNADNARLGTNLRIANNQVDIWLPGVGFNYAITRYMHAFGGVHKGFSPPGTPTATTTQQARMETAINYELGYRIHTSGLNAQAAW
ncbi:MAG TPA: TonB-dependent receptor plug domain-containing protein, partial [Phnomibacter sp.]|nr:TonB-dependent receptor plug domain-containing protein [Phnomibacter sp.]